MTIPMPDPMVEVDKQIVSSELQYTYLAPSGGLEHGTYLITTAQAEAYASAKVREALESLQWISVADRLPDERERVLAFGRIRSTNLGPGKLGISVAWRIADRYFTDGASNVFGEMLCVTHWMPLPAPPLPGPVEPTT